MPGSPSASVDDPLGEPRFEIQALLGRGGMGTVHRAFDRERQTAVALKLLEHATPDGLYRFKQEFRALAGVSHPNLMSLYELLSSGERWFFTMELVDGRPLAAWVRGSADEPLSVGTPRDDVTGSSLRSTDPRLLAAADPTAMTIDSPVRPAHVPSPGFGFAPVVEGAPLTRLRWAFRQLAEGLCALHTAGHLHRDVKPSNVLVDGTGRVVLLDFGITTSLVGDRSMRGRVAGTPAYMSPEQAAAQPVGAASDWYSFGVMLFELLAGRRPNLGTTDTTLDAQQGLVAVSPAVFAPDAPADLVALCEELLRREPATRPSGPEVLRRLGGQGGEAAVSRIAAAEDALLVGREDELASLARSFEVARRGERVIVLLRGSSGAGKSTLLEHFQRQVRAQGALVLASRSYQRESVPFKTLDALLDGVPHLLGDDDGLLDAIAPAAAALSGIFPVLQALEQARISRGGPATLDLTQPPDPGERRRRLVPALRELFDRAARRRPLVLVLDDVQWGDGDSAALLAQALASPWSSPLLLALASRADEERGEFVRTFTRWGAEVSELEIGPLRPDGAERLARRLLEQAGGDPDDAPALAADSAGIPLFIAEMARLPAGSGAARASGARPDEGSGGAFVRALRHRFDALPESARELLTTVALAGRPIQRATAVAAAGLPEIHETSLVSLENHHFLRVRRSARGELLDTFHDKIRESVLGWTDADETRALHGRLAEALTAAGADHEVLALHHAAAGDRARATELTILAAADAERRLAFARAAELYFRVLELADPPLPERLRLLAAAGEALGKAAHGREAAATYLEAAKLAPHLDGLELRRRAAEQLLRCGYVPEGLALHQALQRELGLGSAKLSLGGLAGFFWRRLRLRLRGLEFTPRAEAELPRIELLKLDVLWTASSCFAHVVAFEGADSCTRFQLGALELGEPKRVAHAACTEAFQAAISDGPGSVEYLDRLLTHARGLAARRPDPHVDAMIVAAAAMGSYQHGHIRRAHEQAQRAVHVLRTRCVGAVWETHVVEAIVAWTHVYLGELASLGQHVGELIKEAQGRGDLLLQCTHEAGMSSMRWLAADDPDTMAARRVAVVQQLTGDYLVSQLGFHLLTGELIELLYRGEGERAFARLHEGVAPLKRIRFHLVPAVRVELAWLEAAAALHAARTTGQASWLRAAERVAMRLDHDRHRWAAPLALHVRGAIAATRGHLEEAQSLLAEAEDALIEVDVPLLGMAARWRRGTLVAARDGGQVRASAEAWFAERGVQRPARFAAAFVGSDEGGGAGAPR